MTTQTDQPRNLQYTMRRTGRDRKIRQEFGAPILLPEVEIVQHHSVGECDSYDEVAQLDGEYYYLHECKYEYDETYNETMLNAFVLVKKQFGEDYGGNVWEERTAPESIDGLTNTRGGRKPPQRSSESEPLFAVIPPELARVRLEKADRAARKAAAQIAVNAFLAARDAWRAAWIAGVRDEIARTAQIAHAAEDSAKAACKIAGVATSEPLELWFGFDGREGGPKT